MDLTQNTAIEQLARTKGWVLFFAVLLWIGVAMMAGGGIIMGFAMSAGMMSEGAMPGMQGPMIGIMVGVLYLLMAAAYIYPALKLTKYSQKIGQLVQSPSEAALAAALNEQRAFWKYVGIIFIVFFVLYIVVIIGAVIFGGVAAAAAGAKGV